MNVNRRSDLSARSSWPSSQYRNIDLARQLPDAKASITVAGAESPALSGEHNGAARSGVGSSAQGTLLYSVELAPG
jgi:hypothetical protein